MGSSSALRRLFFSHSYCRHLSTSPSSILGGDGSTVLTSKQKSRAAISLLKTEKNPERILEICRAASLTPESHLDRIAFSSAISKLTGLNYFEGIRSFIEELKSSRPDLKNKRFASHSMVLYGQAGMVNDAVATFEQLDRLGVDKTVKTLNSLIFACILAKKYDEVQRIFVDFPKMYNIKPDMETYNLVIKAFCESGSSSSGYSVLTSMDDAGIKPNATTFGNLIAGFYQEEKLEDVGRVLKIMEERGMKPNLGIYNIRIQSLCMLRRSQEAKALLEAMLSMRMKVNSVSYHHLIHGFCKEGKLEDAKKMFESMRRSGYKPDSPCYFTIIYFLAQGGDYETALRLCKESMEMDWFPNFTTMKILVDGLVSISKVDEATELVGRVKEKFPKKADLWKETEESLSK